MALGLLGSLLITRHRRSNSRVVNITLRRPFISLDKKMTSYRSNSASLPIFYFNWQNFSKFHSNFAHQRGEANPPTTHHRIPNSCSDVGVKTCNLIDGKFHLHISEGAATLRSGGPHSVPGLLSLLSSSHPSLLRRKGPGVVTSPPPSSISVDMAGAVFAHAADGSGDYPGKLTGFVLLTCLVAATGGLIFGYDIGISGGVTSMDSFLEEFFPSVYRKEEAATVSTSQYCKFDSQLLTAFTSSLYLAALVASLFASTVTRVCGRKFSMLLGGTTFLSGAIINGAARDVAMLIAGRILLGVGVGFVVQSGPVYLSEMAPARYRGMLNIGFQLMITVGILVANLVNYGAAKIKGGWGWRISLAGAAAPAAIITLGSIFLPDTPNSLIDRGKSDKALEMLRKIRGTDAVDVEFQDLVAASNQSRQVKHPWKNIVERRYRPQLTMAFLIPSFTQLTGINVIMFYAPVLFKTIGFGNNGALMSAVITGLVNVFATFVSIYFADRAGRRKLLLEGGIQMFICQMLVGTLIWKEFGVSGEGRFDKGAAAVVVFLICVYVAGFAWSWGPMACLVPSEVFPLEIRSAGLSISVSVSMLFTFGIAQVFLALLCRLKFGLFYFFAGWVALMTAFIYLFLPETKNVPLEEMVRVWETHWFWGRFVPHDAARGGADVELEKKDGCM